MLNSNEFMAIVAKHGIRVCLMELMRQCHHHGNVAADSGHYDQMREWHTYGEEINTVLEHTRQFSVDFEKN